MKEWFIIILILMYLIQTLISAVFYHKLKYQSKKNIDLICDNSMLNQVIDYASFSHGMWIKFDFNNLNQRPNKYGKYLICRKDGKIHWEIWNGSGWAYNHNEIRYFAEIINPITN